MLLKIDLWLKKLIKMSLYTARALKKSMIERLLSSLLDYFSLL